jgi:hypothetical protein
MTAVSGYVGPVHWRALVETSNLEPGAGERGAKWSYLRQDVSK